MFDEEFDAEEVENYAAQCINTTNTIEFLNSMTHEQLERYVRSLRYVDGKKLSFEMSGYDYHSGVGSCVVHNHNVVNCLAKLHIYDFSSPNEPVISVSAYKGNVSIHYQGKQYEMYSETTNNILIKILKLTIMGDTYNSRRSDQCLTN